MIEFYQASVGKIASTLTSPFSDSYFDIPLRQQLGIQEHQNFFNRHIFDETEIALHSEYISQDGIPLNIYGRADMLQIEIEEYVLTEFKTVVLDPGELVLREDFPPEVFTLQLKLYAWLLGQSTKYKIGSDNEIRCRLVIHNLSDGEEFEYPVKWNREQIESLLERFIEVQIHHQANRTAEFSRRKVFSNELEWFFPDYRGDQKDNINFISNCISQNNNLLFQAPTGYGKTPVVLYAAVKAALSKGKKIFFATAKTGGRQPILQLLNFITEDYKNFRSMILASRQDLCPETVEKGACTQCFRRRITPDLFERVELPDQIIDELVITPEFISETAGLEGICPIDLCNVLLDRVDIVVGDYNYVFDPFVRLFQFKQLKEFQKSDFILLIDEAHNLVNRSQEMYSVELDLDDFEATKDILENEGWRFTENESYRQLLNFYHEICEWLGGELSHGSPDGPVQCDVDENGLREMSEKMAKLAGDFILNNTSRMDEQMSGCLMRDFEKFAFYYKLVCKSRDHFIPYIDTGENIVGIKCLDAAEELANVYRHFESIIAFSGTLSPIDFYREALGLNVFPTLDLDVISIFDSSNSRVILIGDVDTRFRKRQKNANHIAQLIADFTKVKSGGYLAVFPSYRFLELVADRLEMHIERTIMQTQDMTSLDRKEIRTYLAQPDETSVALVVAGGQFTEAADYPGDICVGVAIAGPCLPPPDSWREAYKYYWTDKGFNGEQIAYIMPGLQKVVQAAGRLIRSESDRGIVMLMDDRFLQPSFFELLPASWQQDLSKDMTDWEQIAMEFWQKPVKSVQS